VNPSVKDALSAQINIHGAKASSGEATILTAADIHAHNTFEDRNAVTPKTQKIEASGGALNFRFPAASVTRLRYKFDSTLHSKPQ